MIDFFVFVLLSQESDEGAVHRTNPDLLKSCLCLRILRGSFVSGFFNLLLVRLHQAQIIIVKHLIEGCNNEYGEEIINLL